MKKLYKWAAEKLSDDMEFHGDAKKVENNKQVLLSFFDYVWRHRND